MAKPGGEMLDRKHARDVAQGRPFYSALDRPNVVAAAGAVETSLLPGRALVASSELVRLAGPDAVERFVALAASDDAAEPRSDGGPHGVEIGAKGVVAPHLHDRPARS